jgi:hypothetical protein
VLRQNDELCVLRQNDELCVLRQNEELCVLRQNDGEDRERQRKKQIPPLRYGMTNQQNRQRR